MVMTFLMEILRFDLRDSGLKILTAWLTVSLGGLMDGFTVVRAARPLVG